MPVPNPADAPSARLTLRPPMIAYTYGEPRFHTPGDVAAVAFRADGTVASVDETGVLCHWSADGELLHRAFLSDLETVWAFAPGAVVVASGNDDLIVWDAVTGNLVHRHTPPSWVTAIGFGPAGGLLVSGHDDGRVDVRDAATHQSLGVIVAHPGQAVSAVAVSPDGAKLATAGEDRVVRVWDVATKQLVQEFKSHTDRVPALAWSPDGTTLVSAGWDTSARVWRLGQPDPVILLNSHAEQVLLAAFAPGGVLATADSDHDLHLWADAAAGTVHRVLRGHADEVRALAFNADGSRLATAGADRVVHVWDAATGTLVAGPNPAGRHAVAAFPGPDGSTLLASTGGPTFRVWDAATGLPAGPADGLPAYSVAADPAGRFLAVGGADHVTRLHDLAAPHRPARLLEATKPPIGAVAVSADGGRVAHTSPTDGLAWVWATASPAEAELILIEAADGCTLESLAFHPDGNRVAVGGVDYLSTGERDGAVCVWNLATRQKEVTFDTGVAAVAFDPTGRYLAGAGIDDKVYLWDTTTEEVVFALDGHQDKILSVAFSPDGSYLVTGGDDMTVRVWDTLSGRLLVVREFDAAVQSLAFGPDGKSLFTGNGNTTCHRVDFQRLLDD